MKKILVIVFSFFVSYHIFAQETIPQESSINYFDLLFYINFYSYSPSLASSSNTNHDLNSRGYTLLGGEEGGTLFLPIWKNAFKLSNLSLVGGPTFLHADGKQIDSDKCCTATMNSNMFGVEAGAQYKALSVLKIYLTLKYLYDLNGSQRLRIDQSQWNSYTFVKNLNNHYDTGINLILNSFLFGLNYGLSFSYGLGRYHYDGDVSPNGLIVLQPQTVNYNKFSAGLVFGLSL